MVLLSDHDTGKEEIRGNSGGEMENDGDFMDD